MGLFINKRSKLININYNIIMDVLCTEVEIVVWKKSADISVLCFFYFYNVSPLFILLS